MSSVPFTNNVKPLSQNLNTPHGLQTAQYQKKDVYFLEDYLQGGFSKRRFHGSPSNMSGSRTHHFITNTQNVTIICPFAALQEEFYISSIIFFFKNQIGPAVALSSGNLKKK